LGRGKTYELAFYEAYADEAFAVFSQDFLAENHTPAGFDLAALEAYLKRL
jgi:hypothetical protein